MPSMAATIIRLSESPSQYCHLLAGYSLRLLRRRLRFFRESSTFVEMIPCLAYTHGHHLPGIHFILNIFYEWKLQFRSVKFLIRHLFTKWTRKNWTEIKHCTHKNHPSLFICKTGMVWIKAITFLKIINCNRFSIQMTKIRTNKNKTKC